MRHEVLFDDVQGNLLKIYDKLTFCAGYSIAVPNLRTLAIRGDQEFLCPQEFYDMISSRAAACPLSKVILLM